MKRCCDVLATVRIRDCGAVAIAARSAQVVPRTRYLATRDHPLLDHLKVPFVLFHVDIFLPIQELK